MYLLNIFATIRGELKIVNIRAYMHLAGNLVILTLQLL